MIEGKEEPREKKSIFHVALFSRRQFLKRTGMAATGALLTSLAVTVACKTSVITPGTTTSNSTPGSSTNPSSSSTSPSSVATSSATNPTTATSVSTTPTTSGTVPTYNYVPPAASPQLIPIAGTTCSVASDRQYSTDNVWVKSLSANVVVMGITTTMIEIITNPYHLSLPKVGDFLARDTAFGAAEGTKMNADLNTPVSGQVLQINEVLNSLSGQSAPLTPLIQDPYNAGWLIVVQLGNPAELSDLVSPQKYIELVTKK